MGERGFAAGTEAFVSGIARARLLKGPLSRYEVEHTKSGAFCKQYILRPTAGLHERIDASVVFV